MIEQDYPERARIEGEGMYGRHTATTLGASTVMRDRTELTIHLDHLATAIDRLTELNAQLDAMSERLHGPRPKQSSPEATMAAPSGAMNTATFYAGQIDRQLDEAFGLLNELNGTI